MEQFYFTWEMAERMTELRKKYGSQKSVAKKIGISPSYLSELEQGTKTLSVEIMLRLCDVIGVTPNELLGIQDRVDQELKKKEAKKDFQHGGSMWKEYGFITPDSIITGHSTSEMGIEIVPDQTLEWFCSLDLKQAFEQWDHDNQ